ncbi:hypothetical protein LguiB_009564 [Lonicera macranthoides]
MDDNPFIYTVPAKELKHIPVATLRVPNSTNWDLDLLHEVLQSSDIEKIKKIPLSLSVQVDSWVWAGERNDIYSVKSGIEALNNDSQAIMFRIQ